MEVVNAAQHVHLQKEFAVKVFDTNLKSHIAFERFRHEKVAASRIDHPHIIDVVNFDSTEDEIVFWDMEML